MLMSCASVHVSGFHTQKHTFYEHKLPMQVTEGDGMPSQVCLQCVHYINQAFSFKQLCERSDATLKQILASSTFLELKPVNPNEFIVSDVEIEQHIGDGFNRNEAKEERVDESNEINSFFDSE